MPQLLSLSRAARLAGVTRGQLQRQIRQQQVETFEGRIAVSALLQIYPQVDLDRDPILEKLEYIKANAQPKSHYSDGWLPEPEVLVSRLHEINRVLVKTKTALNTSQALLSDLRTVLAKPDFAQVRDNFLHRIERALTNPENVLDRNAQLFAKNMFLKVMTASVKVKPSDHEFFVEGNESILDAGLKSGLHLDYGCSSGNCGACKARVTSGEVRRIKDHDFVLSERERSQGYILACSWTAVTDVELEAEEAQSSSDLPLQNIRTRVAKVEPVSEAMAILHLRTPRTQTLRFMAGQNARLSDEDGNTGEYPIASCPCDGRNLEFVIRFRDDDAFSCTVRDRKIKSQVVLVEGPMGDFVLREESHKPAVFVAYGAGFAPVKSLVEHAISIDNAEHFDLFRVDSPLSHSRHDNLCRAWNDSLDNFNFILLEPDAPVTEVLRTMQEERGNLQNCDIYLAAPEAQMDAFLNEAALMGIDTDGICRTSVS